MSSRCRWTCRRASTACGGTQPVALGGVICLALGQQYTIRHSCKILIAGPCFAGRARRRSRCGRACAAWPPGTAAPLPGGGEAHLSRVLMCFPPHVPTAMPCPHVVYTGGSAAGTRSAASAASASTGGTCYSFNLGETETGETECGGGGVCEHRRYRGRCKECGVVSYESTSMEDLVGCSCVWRV
jgi:hypothetical protein